MSVYEYFMSVVIFLVEFYDEKEGVKIHLFLKESEVLFKIANMEAHGYELSDYAYASINRQTSPFIQRVIKLANLNYENNKQWCEKNGLKDYDEVIKFICDNDLWRP